MGVSWQKAIANLVAGDFVFDFGDKGRGLLCEVVELLFGYAMFGADCVGEDVFVVELNLFVSHLYSFQLAVTWCGNKRKQCINSAGKFQCFFTTKTLRHKLF